MIQQTRRTATMALAALALAAAAAEPPTQPAPAPSGLTPPVCQEALVNPVSGHAECVRPYGAPVEQVKRSELQPCPPAGSAAAAGSNPCAGSSSGKADAPK
jgi:hypothetical protein